MSEIERNDGEHELNHDPPEDDAPEAASSASTWIERYEPDHPWQRQAGESSKAFGKFCEYRDLGSGRSLAKLRQSHPGEDGWSRRALEDLSERWKWQSRVSAWDNEQDRVKRRAQTAAIQEMAERQARDGADMQRLARGAMAKWVRQDPQTGQLVLAENLSPADVARLYRLGFDTERAARGEPSEVIEERPIPGIIEVVLSEPRPQARPAPAAEGNPADEEPVSD